MRQLYFYLHTHWDREWYRPLETFRTGLLAVVRAILDGLESGQLPNFYLDGQAIVLEDSELLEPGLTSRLSGLMADGRLAAGPWYVLADQMLVSGESLVRNLKLGMAVTRRFGQPAMIGYCPDTFGHSQDLPRILAGFGIKNAVVWRGVPELPSRPVFWWESPDGSRVLAYHLTRGYYQPIFHENIPAGELAQSLLSWLNDKPGSSELASPYLELVEGALYPVGCDHLGPPAAMRAKLDQVNAHLKSGESTTSALNFAILPLAEYLSKVEQSLALAVVPIPTVGAELRDNAAAKLYANAYLLPGVLSSRLYLKRENRKAEHRLVKVSEPLYSLIELGNEMPYPGSELEYAWRLLLQNHPHDSICGCSIDEVHDEMQSRTRRMNQVLDGLEGRARWALARSPGCPQGLSPEDPAFGWNVLIVYNLSGHSHSGPVRVDWASEPSGRLEKNGSDIQPISSFRREELFGGGDIAPYYKEVNLNQSWVWAESVPGLGCRFQDWPARGERPSSASPVAVSSRRISNGLLEIEVLPDGSLVARLLADGRISSQYPLGHRIRDVGDGGDTYNFDPLPGDLPVDASFKGVRVGEKGPLVGSLLITYEIDIPRATGVGGDGDAPHLVRSQRTKRHLISTEVSMRKGVGIVFFETSWHNRSSDHRLEVVFDTGAPVPSTFSENHFSLVERKHAFEATRLPVAASTEAPPDRFPCQRFFMANEQVFLNFGAPEYGVEAKSVTVTLLRAISILSRGRLRTRGGGAGPRLPTPGANCLGDNRVNYGWAPLTSAARKRAPASLSGGVGSHKFPADEQIVRAYELAEHFEGPLWATLSRRSESNPTSISYFSLDNPAIRVSSLTVDCENRLVLRLLNVTRNRQDVCLRLAFPCRSVHRCSLDGLPEDDSVALDCQRQSTSEPDFAFVRISFKSNELVTLCLERLRNK